MTAGRTSLTGVGKLARFFRNLVTYRRGELDVPDHPRPGCCCCVARDPGARLRDIAASLGITGAAPSASSTDLVEARATRSRRRTACRNRYHIQAHLPLPESTTRERTVGEVLALLAGTEPLR